MIPVLTLPEAQQLAHRLDISMSSTAEHRALARFVLSVAPYLEALVQIAQRAPASTTVDAINDVERLTDEAASLARFLIRAAGDRPLTR